MYQVEEHPLCSDTIVSRRSFWSGAWTVTGPYVLLRWRTPAPRSQPSGIYLPAVGLSQASTFWLITQCSLRLRSANVFPIFSFLHLCMMETPWGRADTRRLGNRNKKNRFSWWRRGVDLNSSIRGFTNGGFIQVEVYLPQAERYTIVSSMENNAVVWTLDEKLKRVSKKEYLHM